jgi:hypothetical protein
MGDAGVIEWRLVSNSGHITITRPATVVWLHMRDSPPPAKRTKFESPPPEPPHSSGDLSPEEEEDVDDQCSICLRRLTDRTLIPRCSHEFCFECLVIWTGESV